MKTEGNTILITGGTSGIGMELVKKFYSLNNNLIVSSGNLQNLENLKKEFTGISIAVCDLANIDAVRELIDMCRKEYSQLNILINNAGVQYNYSWLEETEGYDKISAEITINLISPMQLIYGLLPVLMKNQNSAIVNISSGLALVPKRSAPLYCATKAAIHIGTKSLRYQLEDTPVKVFEIVPPLVDTKMTAGRGKGKISPQQLVDEFMKNFTKDKYEINIGKTKLLRLIHRIFPAFADRLIKNG